MRSFLKNLVLVFLGSVMGAATVIGYAGPRVAADPLSPTPTPTVQESRPATGEELAVDIYRRLGPSVVNIISRHSAADGNGYAPFGEAGIGSGVIIDDQGHILTNNHVLEGFDRLEVTLADGSQLPATIIGRDPGNDLAVIQVEMDDSLRSRIAVAPMGDSDKVRPGQMAIAIGNPFGFQGSITLGIISSVGRDYPLETGRFIHNMIQTDAAVNPGNSGGPLINSAGELIGINTAIESPIRGFVGVGLTVPINAARRALPDMLAGKTIAHPWLGISGMTLTPDLAGALGLEAANGVYVVHVLPDSPAQRAGIRGAVVAHGDGAGSGESMMPGGGDLVVAVDGRPLASSRELTNYVDSREIGDVITLGLLRDGQQLEVQATLVAEPEP